MGYSPQGRKESDTTEQLYFLSFFFFFLLFFLASQLVLVVKNLLANAREKRDMGLIPGLGRSPGEGHGNPL